MVKRRDVRSRVFEGRSVAVGVSVHLEAQERAEGFASEVHKEGIEKSKMSVSRLKQQPRRVFKHIKSPRKRFRRGRSGQQTRRIQVHSTVRYPRRRRGRSRERRMQSPYWACFHQDLSIEERVPWSRSHTTIWRIHSSSHQPMWGVH